MERNPEANLAARAREGYGPGVDRLAAFGAALADEGVVRGLIGPREVERLWERHLLNSAALVPFLPATGSVIDVGTGAGLPGVVLACLRPDLEVVLLEPMERRVVWLEEVTALLELANARVVRGRAEELHGRLAADAVTARAVAPLDRLARWALPLVRTGGALLALKGSRAADEAAAARAVIERLGGGEPEILTATTLAGLEATTVVRVVRRREGQAAQGSRRASRRRR